MQHGGSRNGAGRPQIEDKRKPRSFKATDNEWQMAKDLAKAENVSASEIIRRALDEYRERKEGERAMRNLADIIEDCKTNGKPDYEELRYSVLVMTGVLNLVNNELVKLYVEGKIPNELIRKMKLDGICSMYGKALNKSPKEYLGWNNDPKNPDYQRFHKIGMKLVDKALKGELPNQRKQI